MTNMLDSEMLRKHWLKFGLLAAAILAMILFAGVLLRDTKSEQLLEAMGVDEMSDDVRETIVETDGVIDIQHWTLENGLRVYYVSAPQLPMVDIDIAFDAGSARDGEQKGVAFLTNALLSEGTSEMDADTLAEKMESLGAQMSNQAQRDMASVHVRSLVDPEILPEVVKTLAQVLSAPAFPEDGFNREQQHALKLLDHEAQSPGKVAKKAFYQALYADQPYANWPHGTKEGIGGLTREALQSFHQQFYVTNNAVVTIVGDIDVDGANGIAELLSENLGAGERAPGLDPIKPLEAASTNKVEYPSEQTHILMGQPSVTREDDDYFSLYVGNHILGGGGMVTRLFDEVREKNGLAYSVYSFFRPMRVEGPFVVGLQTKKDSAQKAFDIMNQTVKSFIEDGPSEEELADAKLNILGSFPLKFDSNRAIADHVMVLGFYDMPIEYFDSYKQKVDEVTVESIKDAFARRVALDKMATVMVGSS